MFDPSTNVSLYDPTSLDEEIDWSYSELDFPLSEFYAGLPDPLEFSQQFDEEPLSPQSQIRNHDCMWSGRCTTHPNECLSSRMNCSNKYVNETDLSKKTQLLTNNTSTTNLSTIQSTQQQQPQLQQQTAVTTLTPALTSNPRISTIAANTNIGVQKKQAQTIPQGRSLLRLNQAKQNIIIKLPDVSTNDFLKDRDYIVRPDTPLSLDDDPPEFKHTLDLAACTTGSNRMHLDSESHNEYINMIKEHLESDNKTTKLSNFMPILTKAETQSIEDLIKDLKSFSDFEDEADDDDDDDDEQDANESDSTTDSMIVSTTQSSINSSTTLYENTQSMHSDHSYTRSKSRVDVNGLGVQTPSDSGKNCFFFLLIYLLN